MSGFDEATLRSDIVDKWGPAGAHVDLYDHLVQIAGGAIHEAEQAGFERGVQAERARWVTDWNAEATE